MTPHSSHPSSLRAQRSNPEPPGPAASSFPLSSTNPRSSPHDSHPAPLPSLRAQRSNPEPPGHSPHPSALAPRARRLSIPRQPAISRHARIAAALLACLALTACGTPTACLANRYDSYTPRYQCISGVQLPGDLLKDTDPNSGSIAPTTVAE